MKITQIFYVIWPIEHVHKRLPVTEPVKLPSSLAPANLNRDKVI